MAILNRLLRATALLTLLTAVLSTPLSKRCVNDHAWDLTQDNYKNSSADQWFEYWRNGKTFDASSNVFQQLVGEFVSGNHAIKCPTEFDDTDNCRNADFDCSSMNMEKPNVTQAYFILQSMVNVNALVNSYSRAVEKTTILSILDSYQMTTSFTQPLPVIPDQDLGRRLLSAFSTGLFLLGGWVSPLGSITTAMAGGFSQISIGLSSPGNQAEATLQSLNNYSQYIKSIFQGVQTTASSLVDTLYAGQPDNNGNRIWDYIKDGTQIVPPSAAVDAAANVLSQVMTAGVINVLWKDNYVYIVGTPSSDCQNDKRGPSDLRFCLGDGNVYYLYMLTNKSQSDWRRKMMALKKPQGFDQVGKLGLSLQDAVSSSVASYNAAGFNYANVKDTHLNQAITSGLNNQQNLAALPGVWTLPVCMDMKGTSIVNIDTTKGLQYPCLCGSTGQDSGAFAAAGMFTAHTSFFTKCNHILDNIHEYEQDTTNQ
ncbi:hypothetical protein BGZ63DRAFT_425475 [Mariannaea sp. PMI_226]|nr:hypothetical protein BGZ63DRAFT_425475 [Mariannaea sp. PMI_226]